MVRFADYLAEHKGAGEIFSGALSYDVSIGYLFLSESK